jgi:hypothetical protein
MADGRRSGIEQRQTPDHSKKSTEGRNVDASRVNALIVAVLNLAFFPGLGL